MTRYAPNRHSFIEGLVYTVGEDGTVLATETELLVASGHVAAAQVTPKVRVSVADFLRSFFRGCHTVPRKLANTTNADSDECGQSFRSKPDSVLIDCGQHSDGPGQGTHVDGCKGVMTRD